MKKRDTNIEYLRILSALMVLTYHVVNTCGILPTLTGTKLFFAYNFLWGGGRMAVNIFVIISAWYQIEQSFKFKKVVETWWIIWIYSVIIGFICYILNGGGEIFLAKQFFPISTNVVWFVGVYLVMLMLTPLLNHIIYMAEYLRRVLAILLVIECIIPTFYPAFPLQISSIGWFCTLYLLTGFLKMNPCNFLHSKVKCFVGFCISWGILIGTYHYFPIIERVGLIKRITEILGMYPSMYFSQLASIPCVAGSICLFYLFKNWNCKKSDTKWMFYISNVTLDVYVLLAMNGPKGRLFWYDLFEIDRFITGKHALLKVYLIIVIAFSVAVILGNIRKKLMSKILKNGYFIKKYLVMIRYGRLENKNECSYHR